MKNLYANDWNRMLKQKNWSSIDECDNVNDMVTIFTELVTVLCLSGLDMMATISKQGLMHKLDLEK